MPHQNRVDPFGCFHAVAAKGSLMGNRGILHDGERNITRTHVHQNWVTCTLNFKERRREIMAPGRYTELFFLDEATAFAAGHRPCAECRRSRYREFTEYWRRAHGDPEPGRTLPKSIDRTLHANRIDRKGRKPVHSAQVADLPDGTIFADGNQAVLIWNGRQMNWGFDGYTVRETSVTGTVGLLTPKPIVEVLRLGFKPMVHETAVLLAGQPS
ncbi:MAG: hypothetical protein JJT95_05925 [Pararhodobacter sp.]|nr:hypothetical protein [Pararhodobacter sp.]